MDNDWTRKAARKTAHEKVREAEGLLREARDILRSNGYTTEAMDCNEACEQLADVRDDA